MQYFVSQELGIHVLPTTDTCPNGGISCRYVPVDRPLLQTTTDQAINRKRYQAIAMYQSPCGATSMHQSLSSKFWLMTSQRQRGKTMGFGLNPWVYTIIAKHNVYSLYQSFVRVVDGICRVSEIEKKSCRKSSSMSSHMCSNDKCITRNILSGITWVKQCW